VRSAAVERLSHLSLEDAGFVVNTDNGFDAAYLAAMMLRSMTSASNNKDLLQASESH